MNSPRRLTPRRFTARRFTARRFTARRFTAPFLLAVVAVGVGACGDDGSTGSTSATDGAGTVTDDPSVLVSDNEFTPAEITVAAGTTVTWNWDDDSAAHNVKADGFQSDVQASGTFEHRFDETGTFTYVCTLHQGMDGTVFVVAA